MLLGCNWSLKVDAQKGACLNKQEDCCAVATSWGVLERGCEKQHESFPVFQHSVRCHICADISYPVHPYCNRNMYMTAIHVVLWLLT